MTISRRCEDGAQPAVNSLSKCLMFVELELLSLQVGRSCEVIKSKEKNIVADEFLAEIGI